MLQAANEGTCLWCGYGEIVVIVPRARRGGVRLPWNLGELAREGRRPDPRCENVARLQRLRRDPRMTTTQSAEMAA
jgi:hypothetical protein